jgi:hypothetical protein
MTEVYSFLLLLGGVDLRLLSYFILFIASCGALNVVGLFSTHPTIAVFNPDSNQYLQFASELIGTEFTPTGGNTDFLPGSLVRQPLYPALIGVFSLFFDYITPTSILVAHLCFAVITVFYARYILNDRNFLLLWGSLIAAWSTLSIYRESLMTEWLVFHLLVLLFLAVIKHQEGTSRLSLLSISILSAALVLTRFEFLPILILPFILAYSNLRHYFFQASIGVFLVVCSVIPQFISYGRFTWGDLSKAGTFALVSGLGKLEEPMTSSIQDISARLAKSGKVITLAQIIPTVWFSPEALFEAFSVNDRISHELRLQKKISWQELYEIQGEYSRALIKEYPVKYFILVLLGVSTTIWIIPLAGLAYIKIKREGFSPIALGVTVLIGVHIFRTVSISFININFIRYYAPTFSAALVASLLFILSNNSEETSNNRGEKGQCT